MIFRIPSVSQLARVIVVPTALTLICSCITPQLKKDQSETDSAKSAAELADVAAQVLRKRADTLSLVAKGSFDSKRDSGVSNVLKIGNRLVRTRQEAEEMYESTKANAEKLAQMASALRLAITDVENAGTEELHEQSVSVMTGLRIALTSVLGETGFLGQETPVLQITKVPEPR